MERRKSELAEMTQRLEEMAESSFSLSELGASAPAASFSSQSISPAISPATSTLGTAVATPGNSMLCEV